MNFERLIELKKELSAELGRAGLEAAHQQASTEDAMNALIDLEMFVRDVKTDLETVTGTIKVVIAEINAETGQTKFNGTSGGMYVTSDSETVAYNSTAIETLCISDPEMAARLKPFRKINTRRGGIVIHG